MKIRARRSKFAGICICACLAGIAAWFGLSASFRASVLRAVPYGGSYATYDRLADSLRLGMSIDEVRSILGTPQTHEDLERGQRWTFFDDGPTAGWACVADFASAGATLRLAYFLNVQHRVFTNSPHREFGSPVDGGQFRSDPLLKVRRDQWRQETRSNQAASDHCAIAIPFHVERLGRAVPEPQR